MTFWKLVLFLSLCLYVIGCHYTDKFFKFLGVEGRIILTFIIWI